MALRVRLTNGGEDVFEDQAWSQHEEWLDWTPLFTYRVTHEYVVDGDSLRVAKVTSRQKNGDTPSPWMRDDVAFYRSAQWETVRRD